MTAPLDDLFQMSDDCYEFVSSPNPETLETNFEQSQEFPNTPTLTVASPLSIMGSPTTFTLSSATFQDPLIDRLMRNYVENIANVLPPLPHPESPYASIYVPNAMVGAANHIFGLSTPVSDLPASNVAVFYALLASSAFQIRGSDSGRGSDFDLIARSFRAKAFSSLQKAFREPAIPNKNYTILTSSTVPISHFETIISAMLAFSSMDVSPLGMIPCLFVVLMISLDHGRIDERVLGALRRC